MKNYIILLFVLFYYFLFYQNCLVAVNIIQNVSIYNYDISDNYIVYEHDFMRDNYNIHYISIFNIDNNVSIKILSNRGETINDSM